MSTLCKTHDFPAKYCCFFCKIATPQCVFCIRDDHKQCPDAYVLRLAQLRDIPIDVGNPLDFDEFKEEQGRHLVNSKAHLNSTMNELKERVNQMIHFVEFVDEDFCSDNIVSQIKKNYQIKADKKSGKVLLTPNFDTNQIEPKNAIRSFRGKLHAENEQLLKDLARVPFQVLDPPLTVDNFVKSDSLLITKRVVDVSTTKLQAIVENGVSKQNQQAETSGSLSEQVEPETGSKFPAAGDTKPLVTFQSAEAIAMHSPESKAPAMCVYPLPIKNAFFTITIEGKFNHSIETIEIGLLKTTQNETINFQKFLTANIPKSYQGPAVTSQRLIELNDQSHVKTTFQEKLFEPGSPFHIRVTDKTEIKVFTDDRKKSFHKSLSPNSQYYLYVKLSAPEVTILIS